jgi:hypothetical protein
LARIGQRYPYYPTLPLPRPSPVVVRHGTSSSTDRRRAQSPYRPRTGSRRPPYARSLRGSSDASPGRRTTAESREIGVMAHRILTRRTPRTPRCIPPAGAGNVGSSGTRQVANFAVVIYPLTHKILQLLLCDLRRGPTQLRHGSEGKERRHPISSTTPSGFLNLFLYLSFFQP